MNAILLSSRFFFILKIVVTCFAAVLALVYLLTYGPQNFLWLSDIGLFLTLLALWFESSLLNSMAILSVFPAELIWNIDFFAQFLFGYNIFGIANYMFNPKYTFFLKSLSFIFHIFMPIIWILGLFKWGYNPRAVKYSIILVCIILISTYLFTDPEKNINLVFNLESYNWLLILMIISALVIILFNKFIIYISKISSN